MKNALEALTGYMACQSKCADKNSAGLEKGACHPYVTISRQTGAGGISVSSLLADFLRENDKAATCPWTVFDRDLVSKALKEHMLPEKMEEYIPEARISEIKNMMEEIFKVHPSQWQLVHHVSETILLLARLGHSIIVGRGGNMITRRLGRGVHVRLIGSFDRRVKHFSDYYGVDLDAARKKVKEEDEGKRKYINDHFFVDINDPMIYDMILNTDYISYQDAAEMIGKQVLKIRSRKL